MSTRTRTPVNAIIVCGLAPLLVVGVTARLSETVFLAVAALATLALYASYALPILLGAVARRQARWTRRGPWSLGNAGEVIAWAAVGWTLFVFAVCTLANALSVALFAAILGGLTALWVVVVRRRFLGPRVDLAHFEDAVRIDASSPRSEAHTSYPPA